MIEAIGYRYVPYRFSLDEERIYELLMGQSIYHNRLDALRELVQNAVDACKLRDAIMLSNDRSIVPSKDHRIVIRYDESKGPEKPAALSVIDTGIGMDQYVIENYFLKVGRSYYKSSDFLRIRSALRRQNLDFNPISEFGIGFMAVFMLGDRVEVETAPWFPARNDAQRRVLKIDGLGRLIELRESQNLSPSHLPGTRVSIRLGSGPNRLDPPTWREVEYYLRQVCRNLDYPILLQQMTSSGNVETQLLPEGLCVPVPQHLANAAFHIEVDNPIEGLKGEIVLFHAGEAGAAEAALAAETPIRPVEQHSYAHRTWRESGVLLRGGFNVGPVPGLPEFVLTPNADARIELTKDPQHPRSLPITDLARSRIVKPNALANSIFKIWCRTLLDSIKDIEARPVGAPDVLTDLFAQARWLEEYNAFEVYRLARTCWRSKFRNPGKAGIAIADWESARGGALWVDDSYTRSLHFQIFELILPKVTELMVGRGGNYYLLPPSRKWKTELRKWHSFIADKLSWGVFAQFTGEIGNVLCDLGSKTRFLNSQYRHKLSNFSSEELTDLIGIIDKLATAKSAGEQANLPSSDLPLLERALDVAGDLLVERFHNRYRLNALVGRS